MADRRLLENGSLRVLEDGSWRLLEQQSETAAALDITEDDDVLTATAEAEAEADQQASGSGTVRRRRRSPRFTESEVAAPVRQARMRLVEEDDILRASVSVLAGLRAVRNQNAALTALF